MATNSDGYALARTDKETERLNTQNQVLIDIAGFTIHPSLKQKLPQYGLRIAELATGTGAFLCSVADELPPDAVLHGFDISDVAFTPPKHLPSNATLSILNAKQDPPKELHCQYDAVFIRFINAAMEPPDWEKISRTAHFMLKPGGILQWYEAEFRHLRWPLYSLPTSTTSALREGFTMWFQTRPELDWAFENLGATLQDVGFRVIDEKIASSDRKPEMRALSSQMWIGAARSGLLMRLRAESKPAPADDKELEDLIERMLKDVESGGYSRFNVHIWAASKT